MLSTHGRTVQKAFKSCKNAWYPNQHAHVQCLLTGTSFLKSHSQKYHNVHNNPSLLQVKARLLGVQGVHDGMDDMKARGITPNVFTYFVLRETATLAKDKRTASGALRSIQTLIDGHRTSTHESEDIEVESADLYPVPGNLLPQDTHVSHWKGYYASDDDEW